MMHKMNNITLNRYSISTNTCYGKTSENFIEGFFNQFQETFFYAMVIQFFMVALMYASVRKGIYWKVLFYSSISGVLGAIFENGTIAYICKKDQEKVEKPFFVIFFFINEIFWIFSEYAIPYLNLIKMRAFAKGKLAVITKYTILGLIIPFTYFRLLIGYMRMKKGYLQDHTIRIYHGYAFGVMALSDLICTVFILYFIRKNNSRAVAESSNINKYIKHSTYIILVTVDIVSTLLSLINIYTDFSTDENVILNGISTLLHCFKCSFILILALDSLLFRYEANTYSLKESSGNYKNGSSNNNNYNNNTKGKTVMYSAFEEKKNINDAYNQQSTKSSPFEYKTFISDKNILNNYSGSYAQSNLFLFDNRDENKSLQINVYPSPSYNY